MQFDHNIVAALVRKLGGEAVIHMRELAELRSGRLEFHEDAATRTMRLVYHEDRPPIAVQVTDERGRPLQAVLLEGSK